MDEELILFVIFKNDFIFFIHSKIPLICH